MTPKSPSQPVRRSSRASTPTNRATSPRLATSASTPSISSLAPPPASTGSAVRKSSSTRALSPKPPKSTSRPPLPQHHVNQLMQDTKAKVHKVKLQTLHLGQPGDTITIARVKCPVPKGVPGHLIKRFDTNAVSASSLFRAAFPTSSAEDEAAEMAWLAKGAKGKYGDTKAAGVESDPDRKLTGTWIPAANAAALALEYGILRYAEELIIHEAPSVDIGAETAPDSEESPAVRSPRSKRARLASPPSSGLSPTPKSPTSKSPRTTRASATTLSGASSEGVSILQTLSTAPDGEVTETTEVKIDVPVREADKDAVRDGMASSEEVMAEQIKESQQLVEKLKKEGALKALAQSTDLASSSSSGNKRALEEDENTPTDATSAAAVADQEEMIKPGFFGRLIGRKPRSAGTGREVRQRRAAPRLSAGAASEEEAVEAGQQVMLVERQEVEGRRWVAGFGLALAVGATAAAPYLFG
ncbi:hypothetical protein BCR35DRAFT_306776 [Leucosporidium creatinivorum]|uniref:HTH APSES-type domain-containing protein n=1 Tax=Leucosporidium creatinivorum TaxID=106004 RepID=A0A1Y2ERU2_9BASI|nr:hypothetical protein BCR35DRAFT_306776 [Leucosporidium creatinivorum]